MLRALSLSVVVLTLVAPRLARADEVLADVASVHAACRASESPGRRAMYVLDVAAFRFARFDAEDERLRVDTRRNLRALGGAVELLPAGLEEIAFVASPERARALRQHARGLRVGFFLGFDGVGQSCVIRPAVGVTLVRAELAFVELVDGEGEVLAREDSERLRAWLDDEEQDAIAGEGPRAEVSEVSVERGVSATDAPFRTPALVRSLGLCHATAVRSGASPEAMAVVRLQTDASGRVVERGLAISDLGSDAERTCVLEAVASLPLPPGERVWRVHLRFAAD